MSQEHGIMSIFCNAIEKETAEERKAYLDEACGNDADLRAKVEELLKLHEKSGDFLEVPALGMGVTLESPRIEGPGTTIGRYKLLELIGEGGMGLVYLAEQQEPIRRRVALKIVKLGMDTKQVIARFEAEKQMLALLDHPNIARVYDAGTTETGRPYFVMEYVKGQSITEYCDQHKTSIEDRLKLFRQVCEGVQYAHQKGIIHRDIKPSNILVTVEGDRTVPKIIDFGIAKAVTQPLTGGTLFTQQGQLLGTPEYMSPEQVDMATQDIDTRSDIYSLGVVLYQLLAGVLPFGRESFEKGGFAEIQRVIQEVDPPLPSTALTNLGEEAKKIAERRKTQVVPLARRLHRELEWIPLKAMRKERVRRYRSASELADDIQNYLNGNPLIAGPETAIYRVRKFVRRHAGSVATVVLVSAAIILGLVISTAMYYRSEKALQREAIARGQAEQSEKVAQEQKSIAETKTEDLRRAMYVNSIQLADAKYREGNIGRVRQLLASCPNDLRGWEWDRLNYVADQSIVTLRGHSDWASPLGVSPDGKHVISTSSDNNIKIWELLNGIELQTISKEHGGIITCATLSSDGRWVATGDNTGQVDIWDITIGRKAVTFKGHDGWVSSLAFSPDGKRIVSGSWDKTAKIWDAMTGTRLFTLIPYIDELYSVSFSPDGKRIATAGYTSCTIKIWDAATAQEIMMLKGHKYAILSASFSPNNKFIASAGDNEIKIWDSTTGAELMTLRGHDGPVESIVFSPDGKRIASGSIDCTIKLWDTATGENEMTLRGHENFITSVVFTPDGDRLISGSADHTIKVWDVGMDRELTRFVGHKWESSVEAFSPDSRYIFSASSEGIVKVWDVANRAETMSLSAGGGGEPFCPTALSPDGRFIALPNNWDRNITIRDAITGTETLILRGHEAPIISLAFSPDNKRLASGSRDKTIKIWNIETAKAVMTLSGHKKAIVSVAFSPDSKRIASAGSDFAPPSLDRQGEIKVWDIETGTTLITLPHDVIYSNVAFSPDGRKIICGSWGGTIKIWDSTTGVEQMALRGHADFVTSVRFSPDGGRIVSSSRDRTAKLWDSKTGTELLTLRYHFPVSGCTFSPDGRSIAAGTFLGDVVLWESIGPTSRYGAPQAGKAAYRLVEELYKKHSLYYEVINELQTDMTINEHVRKMALQIANSRRVDDIWKLAGEAKDLATSPDKDIEIYRQALKKAEMASHLAPDHPMILLVLGMTQYRVGAYQDALNTLTKAQKIFEKIEGPTYYADVVFIASAMAAHKLGQDEHTEEALQRIRNLRKQKTITQDTEEPDMLAEAEKLLSGEKK